MQTSKSAGEGKLLPRAKAVNNEKTAPRPPGSSIRGKKQIAGPTTLSNTEGDQPPPKKAKGGAGADTLPAKRKRKHAGKASPASLDARAASIQAPANPRPPAARRGSASPRWFTLAEDRYHPRSELVFSSSNDYDLCRGKASGRWYLSRNHGDEPTHERHLRLLTIPEVVQHVLCTVLPSERWDEFAAYLLSLHPQARAESCPADPADLVPPEQRATFAALLSAAGPVRPGGLVGFLAGEVLQSVTTDAQLFRDLVERFSLSPEERGKPIEGEIPWGFALTLPPVLDGLCRAMLAAQDQTPAQWARAELVSSVQGWLATHDFDSRLEKLAV